MSSGQQTPIQFTPNRSFMARPSQQHMPVGSPSPQRPNIIFRPGMTPQQQQQQQQMLMANGRVTAGALTPQQQQMQLQQQMLLQQQQQQQQQIRPGMVSQQQMFVGNPGLSIPGQQPHPALIQGQAGRKRKSKAHEVPGSAPQDEDSGDELDQFQPFNISVARYQQNHSMMSDVFAALPTSTIEIPKHYYENLNEETVRAGLDAQEKALDESKARHRESIKDIEGKRTEFAGMMKALVGASYKDVDEIKKTLESKFDMEFVDNPYRTVERVEVGKFEPLEGATYKQL